MLEKTRFSVLASTWSPHRDRFLPDTGEPQPSPVQLIEMAAQVDGLEGIELIHPAHIRPDNLSDIRSSLDDNGLALASIAASISGRPEYRSGSLTNEDPTIRRQAINTVKTAMDLAAELGSGRINLWLGRDGYDYAFQIDYDWAWERLVEGLTEIAAHRRDIRIGIEYKIKEPRRHLLASTAAKTLWLIDAVGASNLGVLLDTGHALFAYENLAESVALLSRAGRLVHVHFNDNTRLWDDDMIVGSVHFLEILEMLYWLDRVGYDGWLSFDPHPTTEPASRAVEESIGLVKGMISILERIGVERIQSAISTHQVTEIMALLRAELFER